MDKRANLVSVVNVPSANHAARKGLLGAKRPVAVLMSEAMHEQTKDRSYLTNDGRSRIGHLIETITVEGGERMARVEMFASNGEGFWPLLVPAAEVYRLFTVDVEQLDIPRLTRQASTAAFTAHDIRHALSCNAIARPLNPAGFPQLAPNSQRPAFSDLYSVWGPALDFKYSAGGVEGLQLQVCLPVSMSLFLMPDFINFLRMVSYHASLIGFNPYPDSAMPTGPPDPNGLHGKGFSMETMLAVITSYNGSYRHMDASKVTCTKASDGLILKSLEGASALQGFKALGKISAKLLGFSVVVFVEFTGDDGMRATHAVTLTRPTAADEPDFNGDLNVAKRRVESICYKDPGALADWSKADVTKFWAGEKRKAIVKNMWMLDSTTFQKVRTAVLTTTATIKASLTSAVIQQVYLATCPQLSLHGHADIEFLNSADARKRRRQLAFARGGN